MPNSTINATVNGLNSTAGNVATLDLQVAGSTVASVGSTGISVTGTLSSTGVSSFPAGSASAPSIAFTGDTNTGIYSPAADTIAFTEGGTEAMRIDSSGNVGIGKTSPAAKLDIVGGSDILGLTNTSASGYEAINMTVGTQQARIVLTGQSFGDANYGTGDLTIQAQTTGKGIRFGTNGGTNQMFLNSSGDLGIGTTSPVGQLTLNKSSDINVLQSGYGISWGATSGSAPRIIGAASDAIRFIHGGGSEAMRINANGRLLIGTTSDGTSNPIVRATGGSNIVAFGSGQGMRILSSGEDNFTINTWTNTPNPNFLLGYGNGSGSVDTSKERVTVNAGTWAFQNSNLSISGSLSKGSGSFKINHPLPAKTDTHFLVHSFIESPQADLIYRGKIQLQNGTATVNIDTAAGMTDGTFVLLCRDVQCFTSNESDWDAVRGSVSGNILTIECQNSNSNATISWMVIGERQDPHMYETDWTDNNGRVIVEPEKKIEDDQNLYFSGVVENA